eukprot:5754168-Alexandrium_andersonii.AAC.1
MAEADAGDIRAKFGRLCSRVAAAVLRNDPRGHGPLGRERAAVDGRSHCACERGARAAQCCACA